MSNRRPLLCFIFILNAAYRYFNANRIGYSAETHLKFRKDSFRLGLRRTEAEVLFESPVQSREKSLSPRLETMYADII